MPFPMSRRLALSGIAALGTCLCLPAAAQDGVQQQASQAEADASLPAVEVVGRRQSGSYHADEASGTKTDLPLRELPQAVRIMSRQTLDDLGATRIDDALDYVGGISRQNNFGGLWDNVAIRGIAGDINSGMPLLLNGFSGNRGFNAPRDTANVERIEFLKGPAASLYGTSEPGGTINVVTKKPLWKAAHSVELYAGTDDFYRTSIDTTGPLGERVAYRLNAAVENRGSFREHVDAQRAIIAPALTWKLSPATRLDYSGEVLRHETPLDRGIVAVGNRLGDVPRSRFLGEPADGDVRVDNQTHQLALEHMFNARWSSRIGLSYKEGSLKGYSTEAQPALASDGRSLPRQRRYRDYASDDVTLQAELIGRLQAGAVAHELLAGMETYRLDFDQRMLRANPTDTSPYAIDVFNPVYGQPRPVPLPNTDTSEDQKNLAFYLQDAMSLGEQWRLLAGVRFDRYDQSLLNNRSGARSQQSPTATSPRLGISYLANAQWTLFANAGKSFRPNNGSSASAAPFDPESGRAAEVGAKWENAAGTLGATLALYDIRKKNVLTADPVNTGFSMAAGEVRSRGMDFDLSGQLSRHWRVNASLAYIDAEVERDNLLETGGRLLNIPRLNGSLLAMYEDALANGTRYGIGGGFTHSASRLGEARTQAQANAGRPAFELPSYTVARLAAYWRLSPTLRLSLDVENLFDKTYYASSFQRTWVSPGNPRTVVLGLQAKF
ncbi:TonB-dependent siderophore receptor [Noviherbaspirillum aerium]|uniref:TonB-dependent siderophore receptor n=1 Tax=Noviherbaspirillum aerium TaxID=2588497 RepID=UPI00124BCD5D|nr:TonB-dependent receptor [Noviherbaspirillum aerium]